jgi:prepilin-type processing-associated H-X9-DG protein
MSEPRSRFTLIDLAVVLGIVVIALGLIVPAIQRAREKENRVNCTNNLKLLGSAALKFHDSRHGFPRGRRIDKDVPTSGAGSILHDYFQSAPHDDTGFATILDLVIERRGTSFREEVATTLPPPNHWVAQAWYYFPGFYPWLTTDPKAFTYRRKIERPMSYFFCPSNRSAGTIDFKIPWVALGLPAGKALFPGATDYAMCKGTNAYLDRFPYGAPSDDKSVEEGIPKRARGIFDTNSMTRIQDITDGQGNTFLFGEVAGNNPHYLARANYMDTSPALDSYGRPVRIDQPWGVPVIENAAVAVGSSSYLGSFLAVTAQYGGYDTSGTGPGNPIDGPEPLNAPLIMASIDWSGTPAPSQDPWDTYNNPALLAKGMHLDTLNGFRSIHPGGANFCFADGSVRFISTSISQHIYEAMSTYQGGELIEPPSD